MRDGVTRRRIFQARLELVRNPVWHHVLLGKIKICIHQTVKWFTGRHEKEPEQPVKFQGIQDTAARKKDQNY